MHGPVLFPLLQFVEIFLKKGSVLIGADDPVDKQVIDKESWSRIDDLWHVVLCREGTANV